MTIIEGSTWPHLRGLDTTTGFYESLYRPNGLDSVVVLLPDGDQREFRTPNLADWRLTLVGGKLAIRYSKYVANGKAMETVVTDIEAGAIAGDGMTGPAPAPTGGGMTDAQFQELKTMLANIAQGTDRMWTDVVGRLKAHSEEAATDSDRLMSAVDALPSPQEILLAPAAEGHWGLDDRARSGAMLQDMIMVLLSDQAKMQVAGEAMAEAMRLREPDVIRALAVFLRWLFAAAEQLKADGIDLLAPPQG